MTSTTSLQKGLSLALDDRSGASDRQNSLWIESYGYFTS